MTARERTDERPFGAVGIAMVTPFTPDGEQLDLDAAQSLAAGLVSEGTDMLVLNGTTGESATTSDAEKTALVRAVREAVGPQPTILAGVGTNDTRHSVSLAREAAREDIDGLLVVTPYYSKPAQDGIAAHIETIADATELPVMLYDIPGRSSVPLERETILRLAEHPRILALKDAKGDLQQASLIMRESGLVYYSGEDALNLPWISIGAAGIVSVVGHVAPALEARMVHAALQGDLSTARSAHSDLAPYVEAIMNRMPGAVAAKTALHLQGRLPHAAVRGPHSPASEEQRAALADALRAAEGASHLTTPSGRTKTA